MKICHLSALLLAIVTAIANAAEAIPPIPRVLPPEGMEIPADVRARLETRLAATKKRLEGMRDSNAVPDIEVFTKAVEWALLHREFYADKDFAKADWALDQANQRLNDCAQGKQPWQFATGTLVRGYRSIIDGSAQPYGLVIPEGHDFEKPCPLYVWLHGRGDKNTDLHFLSERASRPGQIAPPGAIVVHPFGRHCVGWKHAGEIEVLEAVNSVKERYKIDDQRIVLIGFSMGGAGAWHIGAHYTHHWVAVCPGAGFAETARYQKLTPDRYPEWYVQKLWGLYDVPDYVRNLFNTNVIAYSGELDPQRQAAVLMEEAYQAEGRTLTHLIGPGVEHKYEPGTLAELLKRLEAIVAKGRKPFQTYASETHLQTRTLRYGRHGGVEADGLEEHWLDSRIDVGHSGNKFDVKTKNISAFTLFSSDDGMETQFVIDGQDLPPGGAGRRRPPVARRGSAHFVKKEGRWAWQAEADWRIAWDAIRKRPRLQGPIDDAFVSRFIVVAPTGKSRNSRFQEWVDFELAHFCDRWRALMRGEAPVKKDVELTDEVLAGEFPPNLILFGDPDSNCVMARLLGQTPIGYKDGSWTFGGQNFDGDRFVPAAIFPRQREDARNTYIVLNSGLTFREGHDRTNSQQNPKLPDWAIIDISQPPDAFTPGRIHDADFFDEQWRLKRQPKGP